MSIMSQLRHKRPSKHKIGQIAENQPELLNLLIAYFVFEWKAVRIGTPPHGVDQNGIDCHVPDYIEMWTDRFAGTSGIDMAVYYLLRCPEYRKMDDPGYVSEFLAECAYDGD